jgi:AcrR family transcriptional regulator
MTSREIRKTQITAQRQQQIMDAAVDIFSKEGFAAATVPDIARLANVAIGTIYIYYPGKRELFVAAVQRLIMTASLLNFKENLPEADFAVTFKRILQDRLSFAGDGNNMARLLSMMSEIQRDPELKALYVERFVKPITLRLEQFTRRRIAAGEVRRLNPDVVARAVYGMIIGFALCMNLEGDASPLHRLSQAEITDEVLQFLSCGVLNEKKQEGKGNPGRKRRLS